RYRTHSHAERVRLQLRHTLSCRSTASVRTDLARIRTRRGCSYSYGTPSPVGAPPSVRTGPAHIRTRRGCSYGYGTTSPVGAPPSVRTVPRRDPLINLKPDGPLPATPPRARTWRRSCD